MEKKIYLQILPELFFFYPQKPCNSKYINKRGAESDTNALGIMVQPYKVKMRSKDDTMSV